MGFLFGCKGETTGLVPAIWLRYWKEDTSNGRGTGKTLQFRYSQMDPPFDRFWEVLYDG